MLVVPENYISDLTEWMIKCIIKSVKSVKDQKEISIRDHPFSQGVSNDSFLGTFSARTK